MNESFFSDSERLVYKEALLTDTAHTYALSFLKPKRPKDRYMRNPPLTSAQLRNFYHEVKRLEEQCINSGEPETHFSRILPLVKMLKSRVAYACPSNGRDRKVPQEFREFLEECVDNVNDWKDFQAFALHFEAVVGFFYGEGGR